MLYGVKVYIEPEDVLNKLSEEDRKRFNRCVFTDVSISSKGLVNDGVEISCMLFNEKDEADEPSDAEYRYRLYDEGNIELLKRQECL